MYFSRLDLIAAWNQDHSAGTPLPSVKTLDLVGLFEGILRGRANAMPCPTAQQMVFVPNAESVAVAKEMKVRGGLASYNPGKMIV